MNYAIDDLAAGTDAIRAVIISDSYYSAIDATCGFPAGPDPARRQLRRTPAAARPDRGRRGRLRLRRRLRKHRRGLRLRPDLVRDLLEAAARRRSPQTVAQLEEEIGFEPTDPCGPTVFKTVAFDHSATPPDATMLIHSSSCWRRCSGQAWRRLRPVDGRRRWRVTPATSRVRSPWSFLRHLVPALPRDSELAPAAALVGQVQLVLIDAGEVPTIVQAYLAAIRCRPARSSPPTSRARAACWGITASRHLRDQPEMVAVRTAAWGDLGAIFLRGCTSSGRLPAGGSPGRRGAPRVRPS